MASLSTTKRKTERCRLAHRSATTAGMPTSARPGGWSNLWRLRVPDRWAWFARKKLKRNTKSHLGASRGGGVKLFGSERSWAEVWFESYSRLSCAKWHREIRRPVDAAA